MNNTFHAAMVKFIFILFLGVHGLIHLIGFLKSVNPNMITQFTGVISRPMGIMWILAALLLTSAAAVFALGKSAWPYIALTAVLISQIMILSVWRDARVGTIANVIILVVALPAIGEDVFRNKIHREQKELLSKLATSEARVLTQADLYDLPTPVQTWVQSSGVVGKPPATCVRLKQRGEMKTKPDGVWMPFTAEQYFDVQKPAFIWTTRVEVMPFVYMTGRDRFDEGQGAMLIKLLSLVNVVNERNNPAINAGSMTRFLGEICWFPSAVTGSNITWDSIDASTAKATFTIGHEQVSGLFRFNAHGDVMVFEADRYYGGGPDAQKEKWIVEMQDYAVFEGVRVPSKCTITWRLKEGDFTWLKLEITDFVIGQSDEINSQL